MTQISWRADDELVTRAKQRAQALNKSLNEYVTAVVEAATDPRHAGSEAAELRERLGAAGLLAEPFARPSAPRPRPEEVRAARRRAARGKPVSEILLEDRG